MKIAIVSDSHDRWDYLGEAVRVANENECEFLLFAGDLIAPPGIAILQQFKGKVIFVWGNNEGEIEGMTKKFSDSKNIELCGKAYAGEIGGLKVFMNHYPEISVLAAESGEYDLCVYGHDHEYFEGKKGDTILLNPGEIQGYLTGNKTFMIFDTKSKEVEKITL